MSSEIAILAEDLSKTYLIYGTPKDRLKQSLWRGKHQFYRPFNALKDVSFTIKRGETVGIVGRNGSGKSTLLQMICGTVTPTSGICAVNGRVSALLELGAGFNPEFTGHENIFLNAAILGLSQAETRAKYDAIVEFSGIRDHIQQPVKTYSSGMVVRLAFAVAAATDPDILVVDEALAVGDEAFQRKCFARIRELQKRGATILFVSHAAQQVIELCDRALLLDRGECLAADAPKKIVALYQKLLYADAAKQELIRSQIKQGTLFEEQLSPEDYLVMKPESTVSYASRGALISNPRLLTLDHKPVSILVHNQEYCFAYDVEFHESAEDVRFGMMVKTMRGVEVAGHSMPGGKENFPQGSSYTASFQFKAAMLPGTYFLNAGCSAVIHHERVFLHRIADAAMFKIAPELELNAAGLVDLDIKPQLQAKI